MGKRGPKGQVPNGGPSPRIEFRTSPTIMELTLELERAGFKSKEIYEKGIESIIEAIPGNCDLRLKEIEQEETACLSRIVELAEERASIQRQKESAVRKLTELNEDIMPYWEQFREAYPKIKAPPESWKGDNTIHSWFKKRGKQVTLTRLYDFWKEGQNAV